MADRAVQWRAIADRLADDIRSGRTPVGSRLPTYADQAAALGVSQGPVRKAVAALVAAGALRADSGVGIFVAGQPPAEIVLPDRIAELERRLADVEQRLGRMEQRDASATPG